MALPFTRNRTYRPGVEVASQDMNDIQDEIVALSQGYFSLFGDGSDGAFDLNGVNSYSAIQFSGGIYTMLRDVNATNLTVRAGQTLILGGPGSLYRLYGTGALVVENGGQVIITQQAVSAGPTAGSAPGGNSPAGSSSTTVGPAGKGANGNNGAGSAGTSVPSSFGGNGGAGGVGTGGGAGAGGTATPPVVAMGRTGGSFGLMMGYILGTNGSGAALWTPIQGGAGGGSGGGTGAQPGGAGGAGGGVFMLAFRSITLALASALQAPGGGGDPSAASGGAGGGGGGGGYMRIVCLAISVASGTLSAATNCPGGPGGAANGAGTAGAAGAAGKLELVVLPLPPSNPPVSGGAHEESGYAAITTSGTGTGHDYLDITFNTPFTAATGASAYRTDVETYVSDAGPNAGFTIRNRTTTGMRIDFDAAFNGEVRWRAYQ
jgi:hypothetical protein